MSIPNDPVILLSYVNTALRDTYPSLDEFCRANDIEKDAVVTKLSSINYVYDSALNKFI